jgi:hypothetical protein
MSIATILLGLSIFAQTNPGSAGMILALSGKATLQRGTSQTSPRLAELLQTGDRIRVESGNLTFLFCPSSERIVLSAGTTIELQPNAVRVVGGAQPAREATKCALPQVALGKESLERIGAVRGRGNPPISLFTGGPLTTVRPVFEWASLGGSPNYQVTVKNSDDDVVWQQQTSASKLVYPASMAALPPGSYSWEVHARADGKVVGEQTANFEVKPAPELPRANATDAAAMLMEATALENAGYFCEAAAYFRELQKMDPSDERIGRRLAWLYWNAGLVTATSEQLQKLPKQE